jgi:hypothetical protein
MRVRDGRSGILHPPAGSVTDTATVTAERPGIVTVKVARYGHRAPPREPATEEDNGVQIGIGLPTVLAVPGRLLVDWARRAEDRGFSSLARWGAGFTIGGAPPEMAAGAIQEV